MLKVKTYLRPSTIQGIGLFAGEDIKKGQTIWQFNSKLDAAFAVEEITNFPQITQDFLKTYAVLSVQSGKYILCNDDARFTNHSIEANTVAVVVSGESEKISVAQKDIHKGDELSINYKTIDSADATSQEEYLKS